MRTVVDPILALCVIHHSRSEIKRMKGVWHGFKCSYQNKGSIRDKLILLAGACLPARVHAHPSKMPLAHTQVANRFLLEFANLLENVLFRKHENYKYFKGKKV